MLKFKNHIISVMFFLIIDIKMLAINKYGFTERDC